MSRAALVVMAAGLEADSEGESSSWNLSAQTGRSLWSIPSMMLWRLDLTR